MRIFIFLLFICPSAFAAYTTMTIEGVKQANGVWTAAGVMDTQGFVRTTGAVTVYGTTRNLPVSLAADIAASSALVRGAVRISGPVALALAAYDLYEWATSGDIDASANGQWVDSDPSVYEFGSFFSTVSNPPFSASNPESSANAYFNRNEVGVYAPAKCVVSSANAFLCESYPFINPNAKVRINSQKQKCTASQINTIKSCGDVVYSTDSSFLKLPALTIPLIISGFTKLPSLLGQPTPIKGSHFTPFSEWMSEPYFKNGNWYRDRMDVSPAPTASQPTRVRVDVGPIKIQGATDPQTVPNTGTAGGSQPKEEPSFCEANPQSIACAELGTLEPEPFNPIEKPFQITPQSPWGSGDAQCPAPKVINLHSGGFATMSYQPACDFFRGVRPVIIALAFIAALYIALGIPVGKGD
ncbi:virulence factor TspB C-terminal domain-related protein [Aeromonas sp. HMWF014]|uniref:virulence factor TspB C-terminal domain-related protein n=1 Tax=Aeromonas sp. HMWF014 TaxID=2056850 RepID=UPI000D3C6AF4|nr:virulence factor TspB C-terminal domain-related protein [Aeromonas sp. HMWF014]PTT55535.1 hypothetical protein DBR19_02455 [Aeromonas sp. HMWF014]